LAWTNEQTSRPLTHSRYESTGPDGAGFAGRREVTRGPGAGVGLKTEFDWDVESLLGRAEGDDTVGVGLAAVVTPDVVGTAWPSSLNVSPAEDTEEKNEQKLIRLQSKILSHRRLKRTTYWHQEV
jgi:hypothetical protein